MPSATEHRRTRAPRPAAALIVALLLGACGAPEASLPPSSLEATPTALATTTPAAVLAPGRPFDGSTILDAMRDSRRPGGVPDELETEAIAAEIAGSIWTIDGEPWTSMTIGGSCGPTRCTLDVGGARPGTVGEDLWSFEVIPASGEVVVLDATLRALPDDLVELADRVARDSGALGEPADLLLVSARWLGPDTSRFALMYSSGNEEESCRVDVTVDVASGEVVDEAASGC